MAQRHQRVHGLAGLRDGNDQRARSQDRVAIAEFVRKLDLDRDAHPMFDGIFGDHAGVCRGAAGDDDDLVDAFEIVFVNAYLVKVQGAVLAKTTQQRALHGRRILMDLFVHKGIPAALLGGGGIPIHGVDLRIGHDVAHEIGDDHLVGAYAHGLILIDLHRTLRVGDERGHIGAEEVLPLAKAHDQR